MFSLLQILHLKNEIVVLEDTRTIFGFQCSFVATGENGVARFLYNKPAKMTPTIRMNPKANPNPIRDPMLL